LREVVLLKDVKVEPMLCYNMECWNNGCSFSGVYLPRFGHAPFVAFSAFSSVIEDMDLSSNVTLTEVKRKAIEFCSLNFREVRILYPSVDLAYLSNHCFDLTYMYVLLAQGYGFSENQSKIIFSKEVKGQEISWTLGSLLYDSNVMPWDIVQRDKGCVVAYALLATSFVAILLLSVGVLVIYRKYKNQFEYDSIQQKNDEVVFEEEDLEQQERDQHKEGQPDPDQAFAEEGEGDRASPRSASPLNHPNQTIQNWDNADESGEAFRSWYQASTPATPAQNELVPVTDALLT